MNQIIYSIITEQWSEKMSIQEKNRQEPTEPNLQQNSNIQGKIIRIKVLACFGFIT